jgi:hypothetical protein
LSGGTNLGVDICNVNQRTFTAECLSDGEAYTLRTTCDQSSFSIQFHGHTGSSVGSLNVIDNISWL